MAEIITSDQAAAIRHLRRLTADADLGDLDRAAAIDEIKTAIAAGFDFRGFLAALHGPTPKPARLGRRVQHGRCTWCHSSQPYNCECGTSEEH